MTARITGLFTLTAEHITLLRASWVNRELGGYEYGAAAINPKRPYGNSDVERDIAKLLGIELIDGEYLTEADRQRCRELHEQTATALQIVLATGQFQPGVYRLADDYGKDWQLVEATP